MREPCQVLANGGDCPGGFEWDMDSRVDGSYDDCDVCRASHQWLAEQERWVLVPDQMLSDNE